MSYRKTTTENDSIGKEINNSTVHVEISSLVFAPLYLLFFVRLMFVMVDLAFG